MNKKNNSEEQEFRKKNSEKTISEKHYKNAFHPRSFNINNLTEEDLDELGFDDDDYWK